MILSIVLLYIAALALNWNRLHYGVEISDEAYYVADAYNIASGATPYSIALTVSSGGVMLYSPLVKLYTNISGGTEGIYLYMRQAFFIYKILVSGVLILLFKRSLPFILAMMLPLPYLALSIYSIDNFSYNSLSLSFLLICCVLIYSALQENEKLDKLLSFNGGVFMALTMLVHPMQSFIAVYVVILLFIVEYRGYRTFHRSGLFVAGGLSTAAVVTGYLAMVSGGIRPIINGILIILYAPARQFKKVGWAYNYGSLKGSLVLFRNFVIPGIVVLSGLFILSFLVRKKYRADFRTICVFALLLTQLYHIGISIYRYSDYSYLPLDISVCQAYVLLLLLLSAGWKAYGKLVLLVFTPFLAFYFLYIPFNYSGLSGRGYVLFPSVILSLILLYYALMDIPLPPPLAVRKSVISNICILFLTATFSVAYITGYYGYVYRDAPVSSLTYKMEKGVFRGLYTIEERGKSLIYLEDEIQKVTNENDRVMFRDQAPQAYLMTKAKPCAPSTWDSLQYSYYYNNLIEEGYDARDITLLLEYFKAAGKEPTKIIYILNKERLDYISLWDDDYPFTKYVKQNYQQIYTNDADQFAIIAFERIPS